MKAVSHRVVVVPGDGVGPELIEVTTRVLDATGVELAWEEHPAGAPAIAAYGSALPGETLRAARDAGIVLKGPISNPHDGAESPNIGLRRACGVFANVRRARSTPGVPGSGAGIDIVLVRDVTEDIYQGAQQRFGTAAGMSVKFVTRAGSERIARFAFEFARRYGRRRITVVHKATVLSATDGLFLEAAYDVAAGYPDIECVDELVDAAAMHLVRDAGRYDVLLTTFQYGDILSDLCAGLTGGLGVMPGALYGERNAVFEAAHGSAPKYAGTHRLNPTALILSGALLLDHLGEAAAATAVRGAVDKVIADGTHVTHDLGGTASAVEMAAAVADLVSPSATGAPA